MSEIMMFAGIALMVFSIIGFLLFMLIHMATGQKLKERLEEEYGKPYRSVGLREYK